MRIIHTYSALLALLMTVTFAGCRRESLPEPGDPIRFTVATEIEQSSLTKAGFVDGDLIKNGSILLYGSLTPAGATSTTPKETLFDGTTLSYSTEAGAWTYSPLKYWAQGGTHDFRAVYPASANIQAGSDSDQISVVYTMSGDGVDLMVASAPAATAYSPVSLHFQHACAAVRFFFKDDNVQTDAGGDPIYNYSIKDFKLRYLYTTGTLNYAASSAESRVLPAEWTLSDDPADRSETAYQWSSSTTDPRWPVPKEYDAADGTDRKASTEWLFAVPQNLHLDTNDAVIEFTFVVEESGQEIPVSFNIETYPDNENTPQDVVWKPGFIYTYYISLEPDAIGFEVTETPWSSDLDEYDLTGQTTE